jgi:hypothetical protein
VHENAMDNTVGGAKYNTSGVFLRRLADVVDSMMVIKNSCLKRKSLPSRN